MDIGLIFGTLITIAAAVFGLKNCDGPVDRRNKIPYRDSEFYHGRYRGGWQNR